MDSLPLLIQFLRLPLCHLYLAPPLFMFDSGTIHQNQLMLLFRQMNRLYPHLQVLMSTQLLENSLSYNLAKTTFLSLSISRAEAESELQQKEQTFRPESGQIFTDGHLIETED